MNSLGWAHLSFRPLRETGSEEKRPIAGVPLTEETMLDNAELLSGWEVRGDLACLLCSRTVGSAQGRKDQKFTPRLIRTALPEHADAIRQMRCPYCSGRLWLQDCEDIFVDRRPLSAEELRPRRGRPPKIKIAQAS